MITRMDDAFTARLVKTLNYPDIDETGPGEFIVYGNHRYSLAKRNGQYLCWDVSVYDEDGTLLTDSWDVYLNALWEGAVESAGDIGKITVGTGIIVAAIAIGYLILTRR